ncbi:MAG: signal recognition particle-docking protein FtsY [Meiothermus sp.]|uniref:signal recognition particle-docking protein FtsY n=1 Tax=Meiothermus sp. TaxID=1955249 RepID=UPI0025DD7FBD|nr:signal recognition particle-docking protein FtsY [Meiothermus sp.]MCS7059329.1 signal recognition particle-docking protein FtsY [Meiothermus sp.]MCS7195128.1 signal recognition particle-docking protein FtsY [Meiothermus sp.]MCX7740746.1 signal recognition particle-docking protein FtsY [Meiothermus sp.]MDW8091846.1 signal recognition particle-docking protein FtsY [Meiothermus sp.]MDW8482149.1 signal recognition particle-docking protein FtsY [Meiothermus sp.]
MSWLQRLREGLSRTRDNLAKAIPWGKNPEEVLEELEFALIAADVGVEASREVLEEVRRSGKKDLREALKQALTVQLEPDAFRAKIRRAGFSPDAKKSVVEPKGKVILMVGVNGVGKTTTIAKLGQYYQNQGKRVMFCAGDTFRAAGGAQLGVWGERLGIPVIQGAEGTDPAALAFDAASARKARGFDLLLVDTAGRLHTKRNLMEELAKVKRSIGKADPGEPGEVWLVLDAITGQNGLEQAKRFHQAVGLTGVVVTKLDGTAKGGVLVPIVRTLGVPIKFIGVGERAEDLQPFDAGEFVEALLG